MFILHGAGYCLQQCKAHVAHQEGSHAPRPCLQTRQAARVARSHLPSVPLQRPEHQRRLRSPRAWVWIPLELEEPYTALRPCRILREHVCNHRVNILLSFTIPFVFYLTSLVSHSVCSALLCSLTCWLFFPKLSIIRPLTFPSYYTLHFLPPTHLSLFKQTPVVFPASMCISWTNLMDPIWCSLVPSLLIHLWLCSEGWECHHKLLMYRIIYFSYV